MALVYKNVKITKWDLKIYGHQEYKQLLKLWLEPEDENEIKANDTVKK